MLGPDWTYLHFLDSDILEFLEKNPRPEFPGAIEIFKKIKRGEHKADFFRYYFLFVKGGFFMDSDAMIYCPIDQVTLDYKFVSVNSSIVHGTIFQGILGAEPENPLIKKSLQFFFQGDLSALDSNYHLLCKSMFKDYQENPEKEGYHLLKETPDFGGDRTFAPSGELAFRHYWRNKEGIPCTLTSKNLIYCCVFYNKDYLKLLSLLLKSMKMYSTLDSFDFLVMTTPEFVPLVEQMGKSLKLHLKIFTQDFTTIFQAACSRLFIFDYPEVKKYDKLLYLDTDILIKGDLAPIFQMPIKDLLHGIPSGTLQSPSFGGQFFNFEKPEAKHIKRDHPGINSGTLLFLNSKTIQELFSRIRYHVETFTNEGNQPPYCMDQPFINFHAIKDSLFDISLLTPHVSLYEGNDIVENEGTASICHFSFPIGNFGHKYFRMCSFLEKTLTKDSPSFLNMQDVIGKKYSWNNGHIKFIVDYKGDLILETHWGNGTFNSLDYNCAMVTWSNYSHVLKFNENFSEYISIRISPKDFEFVQGKLIESNLIIYGDSHGAALFRNLRIPHRNLFSFGKTMYSQGRNRWIHNFNYNQLSKNTTYCLVFGEVDVRAHIGKQVHLGRHHTDICRELVESYISIIQANLTIYKAIIIVGVPPPVASEDHIHDIHDPPLPFVGSNSDRVIFTRELNEFLEAACKMHGYHFFNPFEPYMLENGQLNYALSDSCIHIGVNEHILKEFQVLMNIL